MAGTVSNRADASLSFTIYNMNVHTFCRKFIFQVFTEQKVALVSQYFNEQILHQFKNRYYRYLFRYYISQDYTSHLNKSSWKATKISIKQSSLLEKCFFRANVFNIEFIEEF